MHHSPAALTTAHAIPILRVANLPASIAYYVDALAFTLDWQGPGNFASVSRDRCSLFLAQDDQGHPGAWVWIGVNDVDLLHNHLLTTGARIRQAPTNFSWACEIQVSDLDGNVLRFGSESKPGVPFGPWLDMHGVAWKDSPGGGWVQVG